MPTRWVATPDDAALQRIAETLDSAGQHGTVLTGPDGAGKTVLARAAADQFTADNPGVVVEWAVGTATSSIVPLGAFRHLMGPADLDKSVSRTTVLRQARESLRRRGPDGVLVIVDDAHLLDPLSATLLYQLAATASARLVVTVGADRPVPEQVAALWRDGLLDRLDLESSQPGRAAELRERIGDDLAALPENIRAALDYLAVYQPLLLADLTELTGDPLDSDAAHSALRVIEADGTRFVYSAHPKVAEAARGMLDEATARRLRTALVTRWSERAPDSVIDQLQLAVLARESDCPQPVHELVAAAGHALALGDMVLAEKLAATAPQPAAGLPARLILANALAWQGRGREADAILAAVEPADLSETELMAWALPRAANQFFTLSDPTRATAFLQTTRARITVPAARVTLDALAATFAMNSGTPLRALRIADEVLASPHADQAAAGWAASAAALSCARTGRFDDVEALAARALAAEHPGLLRFTTGFARVTTLVMKGRLDDARSVAQRHTDFAELQQPGRAIGEVLVAYVAIAQGDFDLAVTLLGPASDVLAPTGYSWGPLSLMLLAQVLGQQGEQFEAAKVFSRAESRHGLKSALFTPELALAKAWSKAARGDVNGAIDAAREAVQAAERGGQSAIALRALQDAARLGDPRAVFRAQRLSVEVDCVIGRLTLAHARALAAGDAAALADVAADLADAGLRPAAADAAAQAQRAQPVR